MLLVVYKKTNAIVTITTGRNSYSPMMSYGSGGIKMTPNFKSKKKYTKLEYHWITDEGEFISDFTHLGKEVKNQGETVLWSAIENDEVVDIKSPFDIRLEVIDSEGREILVNTKVTINPNKDFYEMKKQNQQLQISASINSTNILIDSKEKAWFIDFEYSLSAPIYYDIGKFFSDSVDMDKYRGKHTYDNFINGYNAWAKHPAPADWIKLARLMDITGMLALINKKSVLDGWVNGIEDAIIHTMSVLKNEELFQLIEQ